MTADSFEETAPASTGDVRPAEAGDPPYPQAPVVEKVEAVVVLLVNLVLPGLGTVAGGILGEKPLVMRGVLQLVLSLILVGYLWAIVTSLQTLQNAVWAENHGLVD